MCQLAPGGRSRTPRLSRLPVRLAWGLTAAALVAVALATPGFLSRPSLIALANAAALVGCVAVGMSFVTLSGNLMSFSLGAVASLSGVAFMALLPWACRRRCCWHWRSGPRCRRRRGCWLDGCGPTR